MDDKLENLIEKLSMLLNSSDKTVSKKPETTTTTKSTIKPVNYNNTNKKIERLPELPPRKVIIDKTSELTSKSQESKLCSKPCEQLSCKVVKNINVDWDKRSCSSVKTTFKNLGVEKVDPNSYAQKYKSSIVYQSQMPNIADEVKIIHGIPLAADKPKYYMELEGDIHALAMIDLDKEGLSEYKPYLNAFDNAATKSTNNLAAFKPSKPNDKLVSNLADQKGSKLTSSSSLISNNSSTSSISSNSSLKSNDSELKRPAISPILKQQSACLDARACLKLKPQIEIETNKEGPRPIVKNTLSKSNCNLSKLDQPRNTIINFPNNFNRNSIKNNTIKQVSFKDHNTVRHSIATIPDNLVPPNDKGTPLPSTPLPAPVRAMLNSISALNNKNNTADTVPTTPAAFSTPIPVVSLPPLPLPLSKTPPRTPPKSSPKPQQQQQKPQIKTKSPLKIGQTSLKQVILIFFLI